MAAADNVVIRHATADDLSAISGLCAAHAAYERAAFKSNGHSERLVLALTSTQPRVRLIIAEHGCTPVGYVALSREFSTWSGREFVHMDCLFVTANKRGLGIGRRLFEAALTAATQDGIGEIQWQTPDWNSDAIRFYHRLGAHAVTKLRFRMTLNDARGSPRFSQTSPLMGA
jgi:GNAT superfamily N-acetyltransferase